MKNKNFIKQKKENSFLVQMNLLFLENKGVKFIKPTCVNDTSVICLFCCQYGHMKSHCYMKKKWEEA